MPGMVHTCARWPTGAGVPGDSGPGTPNQQSEALVSGDRAHEMIKFTTARALKECSELRAGVVQARAARVLGVANGDLEPCHLHRPCLVVVEHIHSFLAGGRGAADERDDFPGDWETPGLPSGTDTNPSGSASGSASRCASDHAVQPATVLALIINNRHSGVDDDRP